ncbi:MAG TPA: hypothetical protein VM911_19470 [Pyrinomonadaceae bacterium]|jgi:hypothetical protein|nr:hypothetical protein [Pyrinomonadaceae bacterium]
MMIELAEVETNASRPQSVARSIHLSIADIKIALKSTDPRMTLGVTGAANRFLTEEAASDATLSAAWALLEDKDLGQPLFDSGSLWKLYRGADDGFTLRFATPYLGERPYKLARFNHDFTEGEVLLHRPFFAAEHEAFPLEYPLDELWLLNLLARGRGVELHCSGVKDERGRGLLFVGQSGAGKTTMSRLWEKERGVEILSDDRIVLRRREDGQYFMYGTPWHGEAELSSPESAPLSAIFFLRHGERNHLRDLNRAEASARLFSCSFPTYYDAAGLDFTLQFFEALTGAVPCRELSFVPEREALDLLFNFGF